MSENEIRRALSATKKTQKLAVIDALSRLDGVRAGRSPWRLGRRLRGYEALRSRNDALTRVRCPLAVGGRVCGLRRGGRGLLGIPAAPILADLACLLEGWVPNRGWGGKMDMTLNLRSSWDGTLLPVPAH